LTLREAGEERVVAEVTIREPARNDAKEAET
jgi:hypothetical protein